MELDARTLGWTVLAGLALIQSARLWWRGAARRWTLGRRRARAKQGEREAEGLLERAGYRVRGRQVRASVTYLVDREEREAEVVADLVVERRGRTFVAEVKTGRKAPNPMDRATRRQLLEYRHAFDVDGVLLVDAEEGVVRRFGVPDPTGRSVPWTWVLAGAAVGWALTTLFP